MTMLASWVGIDTHGPTSAYIVSDSRISWNNGSTYNHGKKVFACLNYPEIFGYAGDVLFPSIVLSQIVEMIDRDILIRPDLTCAEKNKIIFDKLSYELSKYPMEISTGEFQILHITRDTQVIEGIYPQFYFNFLSYNKSNNEWIRTTEEVPETSGIIKVLGSGKLEFDENYKRYQHGPNKSTSRNVFHCFLDTIRFVKDSCCGGAPQLVGIYRKPDSNGRYIGILYDNKCYFAGTEVPRESNYNAIEWRNENFELCDGKVKSLLEGAQLQPDLLRRNKLGNSLDSI